MREQIEEIEILFEEEHAKMIEGMGDENLSFIKQIKTLLKKSYVSGFQTAQLRYLKEELDSGSKG